MVANVSANNAAVLRTIKQPIPCEQNGGVNKKAFIK
jgi:hypothetical protein